MPELDLDGATLFYETTGHISSPAVLLIDAGQDDVATWDSQVETLAVGHFVIRLLPESTPDADPVGLLDHLGIPWAILRHGAVDTGRAAVLAGRHPDRFHLDPVQ